MNWKEEISNPRFIDKKAMHKMFIKQELMRYYMYIDKEIECTIELKKFMKEYQETINDPSAGSSIIKQPDGFCDGKNIVDALNDKKYSLESNLEYYQEKLKTLDKWLNYLSPEYHDTVKMYVCEYQCTDVHEVSLLLKCSETGVKKRIERSINIIYSNFKKIL